MFARRTLVCLGALVFCGAAWAEVIVDTGEPTVSGVGWTLCSDQFLAGEIALGQEYNISGIEVFCFATESAEVTLSIYGDGGGVPDMASLFYSMTFPVFDGACGWSGADDLEWDLNAGTYWVAFETADALAGAPWGVPYPLSAYAWATGGTWNGPVADNWGLRIQGSPVDIVVPEPATLTLCALGLAGFAGRAYRRGIILR